MEFTIRPLTANIGAEITGLDLRYPIGRTTMVRLRKVWLDHTILLFSSQKIDDDQQIAFSRRIGKLELINMAALQLDGNPEIYTATNLDSNENTLPLNNPLMQLLRERQVMLRAARAARRLEPAQPGPARRVQRQAALETPSRFFYKTNGSPDTLASGLRHSGGDWPLSLADAGCR